MHNIYSLLFSLFLFSCTTRVQYVGQKKLPSQQVDVFITEESIKKRFEFIGKGYVRSYGLSNPETIQQKAINKAKSVGADAILIKDYISPVPVTSISNFQRSDSLGNSMISAGTSVISTGYATGFQIFFLRYVE